MAVLLTLSPATTGPGVTCDELYHVSSGKRLLTALRRDGRAFFSRANVDRAFPFRSDGPPVHPPLGNLALGLAHHMFDPAPNNPVVVSVAAARFAPAIAFGMLVAAVGVWLGRREGPLAGGAAAAGVALVPRVFGHAHLAALDTFTSLTFVAAILAAVEAQRRPRWWGWALAGAVWGLALLTRFHGLLLWVPVAAWLIWRSGRRAWAPLTIWTSTGLTTFFTGWPWLWYSTGERIAQYLSSATLRQSIHVFYLDRAWADHDAPWHYPLVMFAVTLPTGLLLLGALGIWSKRRLWRSEPAWVLLLATFAWVLAVFAWPGTPVYDGVRLFLMVFSLWAIGAGLGAAWAAKRLAELWPDHPWAGTAAVAAFVALQGVGCVLYHPCQLSHYSALVGGLAGAEKLGFEVTYWGDSIGEPLLAEAALRADGGPVLFGPNLADFQAPAVLVSSPALSEAHVDLIGWDPGRPDKAAGSRWMVVYRRRADWDQVEPLLRDATVVVEYQKQGVWLSRLVELSAPAGRLVH